MPGSDEVNRNLDRWAQQVYDAAFSVAQKHAALMEAEARAGAPWQDQTANTRQSLNGRVEQGHAEVRAVIAMKSEPGAWLEFGTGPRGQASGAGAAMGIQYQEAHWIYPVRARALHWVDAGGQDVFARRVWWQGMRPFPILLPTRDRHVQPLFDDLRQAVGT